MSAAAPLPVVDLVPLLSPADAGGRRAVAEQIGAACRQSGFFYATGHGIPDALLDRLHAAATGFFALPEKRKVEIAMARGGRACVATFRSGAS